MPSACCLPRCRRGCPWPLPAGWADACGTKGKGDTKGLYVQYCYQPHVLLCPPSLLTQILSGSVLNCKVKVSLDLFNTSPPLTSVTASFPVPTVCLYAYYDFSHLLQFLFPFFNHPSISSCAPQVVLHWDQWDFMWAIDTSTTLSLFISGF